MNKILNLKGTFQTRKHPKVIVKFSLPKGETVEIEHMQDLLSQLVSVKHRWDNDNLIDSALISVHYKRIIPKSRRISSILKEKGRDINDCICGAKFEDAEIKDKMFNKRHVFTYNISLDSLDKSIESLNKCIEVVKNNYLGVIKSDDIDRINDGKYEFTTVSKSLFLGIVVDCASILKFDVDDYKKEIKEGALISLFKTKIPTKDLLSKMGINIFDDRMLDDCTVRLSRGEIDLLQSRAPYLIAMLNDFSKYEINDGVLSENKSGIYIPEPKDEPTIGVIDTHFDKRVYFERWVDYQNVMNKEIDIEEEDYNHGTAVSSIIVDGPQLNRDLEDGCGRFKVKHFGVAKKNGMSSFEILKKIKDIVNNNRNIKVWNLSLGSVIEAPEYYISAEASILDQIQSENDVLFIVAGTNDNQCTGKKRIGVPADSINSIVVNATNKENQPASYSRKGPVVGFFYKPDVSAFGGDKGEYMRVCEPNGEAFVSGTSFAAPWITRKVAFLIYKMGFSREIAKALIIDAAAGWNRKDGTGYNVGYGVVPIHIKDILETKDDEIKFFVSGSVEEYETFNYTVPVPIYNNLQPFWARATMAYFPYCNRNQGVDYTSTEIDLHFGRVVKTDGKAQLKDINNNTQSTEGLDRIYEEDARRLYRKWDNVKYISEKPNAKGRPKKVYEAGMWGLRIVSKERSKEKKGIGMNFGVVVTLKEMNGINRIDEFIKLCGFYGWIVNAVDIETSLDIYEKAEADLEWT